MTLTIMTDMMTAIHDDSVKWLMIDDGTEMIMIKIGRWWW